jgi:ATP-dependent DNA helicase RecG
MSSNELAKMLTQGEGPHLEFKSGTGAVEIAARSVVAFLNQKGGRIVFGVDDAGRPVGLPEAGAFAQELHDQLVGLVQPTAPWAIDFGVVDGKELVTVDVPEGADKPYLSGGTIYLRRKDSTDRATRDEISDLIQQRVSASARWERQTALGATLADLDDGLVQRTLSAAVRAGHWQGDAEDTAAFLDRLGLVSGADVTNAALVVYGKSPTRLLPQVRVRLLVSSGGKTGQRYERDELFESGLLKMAEDISAALAGLVGGSSSEFKPGSWVRIDKPLYPTHALREGVMNALVHRDYASNGAILIQVNPDSIQISNPGGLPDNMSVKDLRSSHLSLPRNPDIAHVCFMHGLIEKLGRGTQMIVQECRSAHLKAPKWTSSPVQTSLTLYGASASVSHEKAADLSERQQLIMRLLGDVASMKAADLAAALGDAVTERTVRNDLLALAALGLIVRVGQSKNTTYRLADRS